MDQLPVYVLVCVYVRVCRLPGQVGIDQLCKPACAALQEMGGGVGGGCPQAAPIGAATRARWTEGLLLHMHSPRDTGNLESGFVVSGALSPSPGLNHDGNS